MKLTLAWKGLLVIAAPFLIQIGLLLGYQHILGQAETLAQKEYHNKEVIGKTNWLSTLIPLSTTCALSLAVSQDGYYKMHYEELSRNVPDEFSNLAIVLADCHSTAFNPSAPDASNHPGSPHAVPHQLPYSPQKGWREVRVNGSRKLLGYMAPGEDFTDFFSGKSGHILDQQFGTLSLEKLKDLTQAWSQWKQWKAFLDAMPASSLDLAKYIDSKNTQEVWGKLFEVRGKILSTERANFSVTPELSKANRNLLRDWIAVGITLNIVMAVVLFLIFTKSITRRLRVLENNSTRLAKNQELSPPLHGTDEIAHLDSTFHSMASDLTKARLDLQASEKRVRTIIEQMPVGLATANADGIIDFVNPSFTELFGVTNSDPAPRNLTDPLPLLKYEGHQTLETGKPSVIVQELTAKNRLGQPVMLEVSLKPFDSAETPKTLAIVHDVTERHELELRKHEFIAMVTHDLRTPLTTVQVFLEMLEKNVFGPLPEKAMPTMGKVERSVHRLLNLVNDILDFQKLEAGKHELVFAQVSVSAIVEGAVEAIEEFAGKQNVILSSNTIDLEIVADGERLIRVLINLISNAVKFSAAGQTVTIVVERDSKNAIFEVQDQGRGIPESHLEAVFEKYKQVEAADAKEKKGTGLGLPICKAIVEQHGGTIGVKSKLGEGSTFWFRIPILANGTERPDLE